MTAAHADIDTVIREEYCRLSRAGMHVPIPKLREAMLGRGFTRNAVHPRLIKMSRNREIALHETGTRSTGGLFHDCRYYHFITMRVGTCAKCGDTVPVIPHNGSRLCCACYGAAMKKGENTDRQEEISDGGVAGVFSMTWAGI